MTRGIINNNPGNIRLSRTAWQGEVPGSDPAFVTFGEPQDGIRAMARVLLNYQRVHGLRTVEAIISRWAPSEENNTAAYAEDVAKRMGVQPEDRIDISDPAILSALCQAIIRHENGQQPYPGATIEAGVAMALA
jgi:hypothetical protein